MNEKRPVALITGASRGIGRGIAIELARHGYDIAGSSRVLESENSEGGIFEVKERVEECGAACLPVRGDVSVLDDHEKMIRAVADRFGRIDLLVNNAGVAPEQRLDVLETTPESFDRVLSINSRGPFFLTQRVARQMIDQIKSSMGVAPWPPLSARHDFTSEEPYNAERRPKIIFITSVSVYMSSTSRAEYCLSKAALSMAAAIFADRLSEYGINVYEVRPGIIKTDMTAAVQDKYDRLIEDGVVPQGRWGLPEDVGKAVVALVSGGFDYSTGAVIEVSGGMNIRKL
ncbi:MAG TPA: 3-ketoacyl-ACP reductase [Blastocatellia bacterium]|nr:3-ketoacyl-ACP reductase [Blastocatellia bacterium]